MMPGDDPKTVALVVTSIKLVAAVTLALLLGAVVFR